MGSRSLVIMDGIPGGGSQRRVLLRQRRQSIAIVGTAAAASFGSLPCEGRGGLGRGVFKISANREHPLPASPCLRRGRGQGKSSRLKPPLQMPGRDSEQQVLDRLAVAADQPQGLDADLDVTFDVLRIGRSNVRTPVPNA